MGQVGSYPNYMAGLMISANGGASWTASRITTQTNSSARVAAIAPSNGNVIYAGCSSGSWTPLIYKTVNGGASWTEITNGIQDAPLSVAVDPQNPDIVYIGTWNNLWRSANGGASWTKCATPGYSYSFTTVVFNPNNPNEVFLGYGRGVASSKDRGLTWTDLSEGLLILNVKQLYFHPGSRTLYAATVGGGAWKKKL